MPNRNTIVEFFSNTDASSKRSYRLLGLQHSDMPLNSKFNAIGFAISDKLIFKYANTRRLSIASILNALHRETGDCTNAFN